MRWVLVLIALFAVLSTALFVADTASSSPPVVSALAGSPGMTLSDYMLTVHGGPKGLHALIKEAVTGSGPADDMAWKAVKARAVTISYLAEQVLAKAKPEKGDAASWKAKVGEYQNALKAMTKAAEAKDAGAVNAGAGKVAKMCEACHKAHK